MIENDREWSRMMKIMKTGSDVVTEGGPEKNVGPKNFYDGLAVDQKLLTPAYGISLEHVFLRAA